MRQLFARGGLQTNGELLIVSNNFIEALRSFSRVRLGRFDGRLSCRCRIVLGAVGIRARPASCAYVDSNQLAQAAKRVIFMNRFLVDADGVLVEERVVGHVDADAILVTPIYAVVIVE